LNTAQLAIVILVIVTGVTELQMKIKVSWFAVANIIIKQIKKMILDIQENREDDGKVTKDEWQDILAENLLELVPELADLMFSSNR
tara:strand:- start:163 stop:420 length:258 start_codon:yes stop_codon:yes gene_type:complete